MTDHKTAKEVTADASGDMIFEPILEDGVFRFDCSESARAEAFPSFSFVNSSVRDTPIKSHNSPSYVPTFKSLLGQQIVKLEVTYLLFIRIFPTRIFLLYISFK